MTAFDEIMAVRGKGAPPADEVSIVNQDLVSQTVMLIHRQGLLDHTPAELDTLRIETSPPHLGPLRHLGPIIRMSQTLAHCTRP